MITTVAGSRCIHNRRFLEAILGQFHITYLRSGGAMGVDKLAEHWAYSNHINFTLYLPDYPVYGNKVAPIMRNIEMIKGSERLIALWDGQSKGTAHIIKEALKRRVETHVYFE